MAREWRYLGSRSFAECLSVTTTFLYRKWGAAIANANASIRLARLSALGATGPSARAFGTTGDPGAGMGAVGALDDLRPDVGGVHGPGF